jgi:hypothetical protein
MKRPRYITHLFKLTLCQFKSSHVLVDKDIYRCKLSFGARVLGVVDKRGGDAPQP